MKKTTLFFAMLLLVATAFATPSVNEKVLKVFKDAFPTVQHANWHEYETFYEVYFDQDNIKCRIRYDFNGRVLGTIRYYEEALVPPFLKAILTEKYPGKKIFGVTEVTSAEDMTYHFVLEDDKNWIQVKSDATGRMSVTEKLKKGPQN